MAIEEFVQNSLNSTTIQNTKMMVTEAMKVKDSTQIEILSFKDPILIKIIEDTKILMEILKDMKKMFISQKEGTILINFKMNRADSFKTPNQNITKIIDIRKIKIILRITFQMKTAIMMAKE